MGNGKLNVRVMTIMNGDGISNNTDTVFYVLNLILLSFSKHRLLVSSPVVKLRLK